jgi:protein TonB
LPPPRAQSPARRWEISSIVFLTILVHGGIAYGAHLEGKKPRVAKHWTKVEVDMVRPPPPPPKVVPPPEPPKPPPPKPKAAAPKPVVAKPEPEKPIPEPPAPLPDTGSSLPSAPDGELHAGSGGLGIAPPAPPPPKPAPPPPPAPVVQAKEGANYLKNPRPPYPSRALREGWEGTTVLRVQVSPTGKPGTIQVQKSSGRSVLDDAALEAVKYWSFTPATQGGNPISGWVTVPIVFKLQ